MKRSFAPSFLKVSKGSCENPVKEPLKRTADNVLKLLNNQCQKPVDTEVDDKKPCEEGIEGYGKSFTVMWGKPSKKKHKTWEGDGRIIVSDRSVTLLDEDGKRIGQSGLSEILIKNIREDQIIFVAGKMVQILSEENQRTLQSLKLNVKSSESNTEQPIKRKHPIGSWVPKLKNFTGKPTYALSKPSLPCQWEHNPELLPVIDVYVDPILESKLRPHQKEGIEFLYKCMLGYQINKGGPWYYGAILADEMGLGKTLQCITLIWTLLKLGPFGGKPIVNKFLIATPSSLVGNWRKEFDKWLKSNCIKLLCVDQKHKPQDMNLGYQGMIISYDMLVRSQDCIDYDQFDLVICDEGHRIKNSQIKLSMVLGQLRCRRRILLTGTPLQNDLPEFYSLANFVNPGMLGNETEFKFSSMADGLSKKIDTFLLRRTQEVIRLTIPPKTENIVFCKATSFQVDLYNHIIDCSGVVNFETGDVTNYLSVIMDLRKACNNPHTIVCDCCKFSLECSGKDSVKYQVVKKLLHSIYRLSSVDREKVVLVSNFTQTLDLLQGLCDLCTYQYLRLDGKVNPSKRTSLVQQFNTDPNIFVLLLSSKAGGQGLNLIGGSRIILYDLDWNPSVDLQTMNRIWREGQHRPCHIYRFRK